MLIILETIFGAAMLVTNALMRMDDQIMDFSLRERDLIKLSYPR